MNQAALREIDATTLKTWLDENKAVLIDIREPDRFGAATAPVQNRPIVGVFT